MKRTIRLTESDISRILRRVIKEEGGMCSAKDEEPSSNRPLCSKTNVTSGKIIAFNSEIFLHYKDESNCPKLCKVEQETNVTLS